MNAQEDETNSKGSDGNFSSSENCNEGNKECYKTGNIPQQIHVEKGMDASKMHNFPNRKCKKVVSNRLVTEHICKQIIYYMVQNAIVVEHISRTLKWS